MRRSALLLGSVIVACCIAPIHAAPIYLNPDIQNLGFEDLTTFNSSCCTPTQYWSQNVVPSWTSVGTSGTYRPIANLTIPAFIDPLEGLNVAYTDALGYIYQDLTGISPTPNTDYALSYAVGRRYDMAPGDYRMAVTIGTMPTGPFWVEGVNMFTLSGSTASVSPGTWQYQTLSFNSGSAYPTGQPFRVWLATDTGGQVEWDVVPEPGTLALLGPALLIGGSILARRRTRKS
jgi:hypothetical protein